LMEKYLEAGELDELAQAWVSGRETDWTLLHQVAGPMRVPLPTYPFAKRRCWFDSAVARTGTDRALSEKNGEPLVGGPLPGGRQDTAFSGTAPADEWEFGEIAIDEASNHELEMEQGEI